MEKKVTDFLPDFDRSARIELIDKITDEVRRELESMPRGKARPRSEPDTREAITLAAKRTQFETLAQLVLGISENDYTDEVIDLDNPGLLTGRDFIKTGYFPFRQDYVDEYVKNGETDGTALCLRLLVPDYISLPRPEVYFSAWKKDILRHRVPVHGIIDKPALVTLPTRLQNMNAYLIYPPYHQFPQQRILAHANARL